MSQAMSLPSQAPVSSLRPESILEVALNEYRKNTGNDLLSHPLASELQRCASVDGILVILQRQADTLERLKGGDRGLMKWVNSSVNILCSISGTLGDGAGLAFPHAKPIFTGIGILLAAAKDVTASHDVLLDLFGRMEDFFKRFKVYSQSIVNTELAEVLVKVVVKVLNILSIATKEVEQSRAKRYIKRLAGRKDIENAMGDLENVIQGEHYTVTAQVLQDTSELRRAVKQMENKRGEEEWKKIREDTQKWFSPPDPSINHNIAWDVYHAGSATWLFDHSVFINWTSTGSLLWVHGKPGSGKSIICSAIIEHIIASCEAGQASIAYYYFDFRDKEKQNARNLVTSLLIQLSAFSDPCCDVIHQLYSSHGNGTRQPTNDVLKNCLKQMLAIIAEHPIYVVMDALDECPDSGLPSAREAVLVVLKDLVGLHLPNLRVCVTSRPEVDIKSILSQLTVHSISLHGEGEQRKSIADYVSSTVTSDVKMREWPDEDKELVIKVLSERADGMFRWVVCQLETLRRSAQRNLRAILEKLPKTLDETYERVLKDINEDNREHARRLLHCLAVAIRPLRVEELAEILTFDFNDVEGGIPKFHAGWRWKDQEEAVLSTCSSLIAVVDSIDSNGPYTRKYRVVQFSHFSVKEFLLSDRLASSTGDVSRYHILPRYAHTILAQACLGFLLHLDYPIDLAQACPGFPLHLSCLFDKESVEGFPLARYAAEHWVAHAQFEDVASHVKDGMRSLFDPDKHHFTAWVRIHNIDFCHVLHGAPNPLYYATLCGFHDLVRSLAISHPQLVNIPGGHYEFPVIAALYEKHIRVAEFLLRHGANVDVWGSHGRTLLQIIMRESPRRQIDIVDLVLFPLKHGADVNFRGSDLSTPLHTAAYTNPKVLQLLLERGADIDSRDDHGDTPLHAACGYSKELEESETCDIILQLLARGANVNAQDNDGATPLQVAASWRNHDIAWILLEHGAEINAKNNEGKTSLHQISLVQSSEHFSPWRNYRRLSVARLLLRHGANVNEQDKDGKTPLHVVLNSLDVYPYEPDGNRAEILNAVVAQSLLECGANVNARDKGGITPLHLAIQRRMYDLARVLLTHGAEPNVTNEGGKTPLHLLLEGDSAAKDDIPGLVRFLLERCADVNARDLNDATPLLLAAERYMDDITQILLERGADPNVKNMRGKSPLHLLLERSFHDHDNANVAVLRLLLERGADVNALDEDNTTPLHLAYHYEGFGIAPWIAQIILDHVNAEKFLSPSHYITLEDRTSDMNTENMDPITHLHWACYFGRVEMAGELLDHWHGANAAENIRGETPLHIVSRGQYDDQEGGIGIVQLLLDRHADVNAQDKGHITPLHLASYYGKLEIVRVLLNHGARVNIKGELGQTALHLALDGNRSGGDGVGIVRLLLEYGADANAQDAENETPLHLASTHGKLAIVWVLLIHGANANATNIRGQTPLHSLSPWPWRVEDEYRLVHILHEGGADVNARDRVYETPLHIAYRNNRLNLAKCLLRFGANEGAKNRKGETPIQLAPRIAETG